MVKTFTVPVAGDSGYDYDVVFGDTDDTLWVSCSCTAGSHGVLCKHIKRLLALDFSRIEPTAPKDAEERITAFREKIGPALSEKIDELYALEDEIKQKQEKAKKIKKAISRMIFEGIKTN